LQLDSTERHCRSTEKLLGENLPEQASAVYTTTNPVDRHRHEPTGHHFSRVDTQTERVKASTCQPADA
jgi:hypothetical protein